MMCIATGHRPTILILALVAVALSTACAADHETAPGRGFYAEVAVEAEPRPGDPVAPFGSGGGQSVVRWWYAPDPARWRWEFETAGTVIDDGVLLTVADGGDSWEYDDRTNVYRRGGLEGFTAGVVVSPIFSAPVGPANANTLDAFMAQWRELGDAPEVTLAGEATLLGRRTQIVELHAPGGVTRAFVDPERMFIMRWAVDGGDGGQSYHAEVTALDYGTEIDPARFTFEPPPGARESGAQPAGSCGGSSYVGGASFLAEAGFLAPTYTPAGYRAVATGAESGANSCETVAVWVVYETGDGGAILLRQRLRPGGMPPPGRSWQALAAGVDEAYHRRSEDGIVSLLWRAGDIVGLLQADAVPLDELVRIADSAGLVPARSRWWCLCGGGGAARAPGCARVRSVPPSPACGWPPGGRERVLDARCCA